MVLVNKSTSNEANGIIQRVGWMLIAVGVADLGYLVYCIINGTAYSSSLNLFAIVAGIFLVRRSLTTVRIVSWLSAFFLAALVGAPIVLMALYPVDLLWLQMKLSPGTAILNSLVVVAFIALLAWVYRQLTPTPVQTAIEASGRNYNSLLFKPNRGFLVGGVLVIVLAAIALFSFGDESAEAQRRAAEELGDQYKYYVSSVSVSITNGKKQVYAVVTAYNDEEVKDISVNWAP